MPPSVRAQALTESDTDRAEALVGLHILLRACAPGATLVRLALRAGLPAPPPPAASCCARLRPAP